jgi:uncharacterized membrane protein HdeD (DUF308 family)
LDSRSWWMLLIRGLVGVVLGLALLAWPRESVEALIMLIGAFALATGVLVLAHGITVRLFWPAVAAGGAITIIFGLVFLLAPDATAEVVVVLVGIWAIIFGIMELAGSAMMRRMDLDASFPMAIGIISLVFGLVLLVRPGVGIVTASILIGAYLLVTGAMILWQALRVRATPSVGDSGY